MGISGLLPFLKKASRPANVSEFSGKTAAIDVYCWLHKGAFGCADKLVQVCIPFVILFYSLHEAKLIFCLILLFTIFCGKL